MLCTEDVQRVFTVCVRNPKQTSRISSINFLGVQTTAGSHKRFKFLGRARDIAYLVRKELEEAQAFAWFKFSEECADLFALGHGLIIHPFAFWIPAKECLKRTKLFCILWVRNRSKTRDILRENGVRV